VDRAALERLIEIGTCAPSAKNMQPWQWIVIYDPAEVKKLDALIVDWMREFIRADPTVAETLRLPRLVDLWQNGLYKTLRNAPHLFVVHVDESWGFGVEDTALALSYVELFAPTLGLGATWSGYFYTAYNSYPPLARAVPVPAGRKVVGAMMVGHPKFQYHCMPRRKPPKIQWR
jgi:nitroreductase